MALRDTAASAADVDTVSLVIIAGLAPVVLPSTIIVEPVDAPAHGKRRRKPRAERFWAHVDRHQAGDACWPWKAAVTQSNGYGKWCDDDGRTRSTHKVAFELANSVRLEAGENILHSRKCTTKLCCRPSHLRKGSQAENLQDAARAGVVGKRKLTPDTAREIVARSRGENGFIKQTVAAIASAIGTTPQNVQHVLHGRTWSKHTGIPPSGRAAQPKKPRAKVEKRARRQRVEHLEQRAAA